MRKIILASASPRRKELLERAGVDFEVLPASGDENRISDNPGEAVKQLASDKAASVIRTMKDSADGTIVIGSDTVVVFENVILGKPYDTEDA
ncbi:MAG: Maf family protein, partial [Blautia wexlerae]